MVELRFQPVHSASSEGHRIENDLGTLVLLRILELRGRELGWDETPRSSRDVLRRELC